MTERQLWLEVAKEITEGGHEFVCFAIEGVCRKEQIPDDVRDRMMEAASRWAHRKQRRRYNPLECVAAFARFNDETQRKRAEFCEQMAAKAVKAAKAAKATRAKGVRK